MTKQGKCVFLIGDGAMVVVGRKWRSKWWKIHCGCGKSRRRKDGTCKHERAALEQIRPEMLPLVRIDGAR